MEHTGAIQRVGLRVRTRVGMAAAVAVGALGVVIFAAPSTGAEGFGSAPAAQCGVSGGAQSTAGTSSEKRGCQGNSTKISGKYLTDRSTSFRSSAKPPVVLQADLFEKSMLEMVREFTELSPSVWAIRATAEHPEAFTRAWELAIRDLGDDFDEVFQAEGAGMTSVDTRKEKPSLNREERSLKRVYKQLRLRARALSFGAPKPQEDSAEQILVRGQRAWVRAVRAARKIIKSRGGDPERSALRLTQWQVRRLEAMLREFPKRQ
jgi:hypothetical protein